MNATILDPTQEIVSGMPASDKELPLDPNVLANIVIEAQTK